MTDSYEDIIAGCLDAVAAIEGLIAAGEFCYQRLWREEIARRRLSARCKAVQDQGPPATRQPHVADLALDRYRSVLDEYARHIYPARACSEQGG